MRYTNLTFRDVAVAAPVTVMIAKRIVTMNEVQPVAEAIAFQDGKIIGVGSKRQLIDGLNTRKMEVVLDERFKENAIYPGFIEAHMHPQSVGLYLTMAYVGYFDRKRPTGELMPGLKSIDAVIAEIKRQLEIQEDALKAGKWLNLWGFDPLMHDGSVLTRNILDQISSEYPICVQHQSCHVINLNSRGLELAGYHELPEELASDPHLFRSENGELNGTIGSPKFMSFAYGKGAMEADRSLEGMKNATISGTRLARLNGCTTIVDKGTGIPPIQPLHALRAFEEVRDDGNLATRVQLEAWWDSIEAFGGFDALHELRNKNGDMLRLGNCKFMCDGSIQGYTAVLLEDQRYNSGAPNGHPQAGKDVLRERIALAEANGFSCSIHTNGNGATELAIQAIEELRAENPDVMFRHSLEHCQMATENQFYRMAKNGITANLFINHIYYWGDVHAKFTAGPHGVRRMDACRSATTHDVLFGIHSDDNITEVNPLFSAWISVNRKSGVSGTVYGEDQCLTTDEAMKTITLSHAKLLHLEDVIGSIEIGKFADFTILEEAVTEENKETFKDIPILGTVLGGKVHLN